MNATAKAIAFLRSLTRDGFLTSEEVWALAKFFNANPDSARCWPGEILVPMLQSAFDDAEISGEEMEAIGATISSIEEEWAGKMASPDVAADEMVVEVPKQPALMPMIDQRIEVPAHREDTSYVVALREHSCTCPEWEKRKGNPIGHPSRCCRHMAYAFVRSGKVMPPWFQALLDDCFAFARGTRTDCDWLLLETKPKRPVLVAGGHGQWCTVFAPEENGYEAFTFNPALKRWSYGEAPAGARLIEYAIRESFPEAQA